MPVLSVFTDVIRGRVVSTSGQSVPVVSGGGLTLGGVGKVRVRTDLHESHEFWLRDRDGHDHRFPMGAAPFPAMLLDHAVTVVVSGGSLCAVANHSTGEQTWYRPVPPYRPGEYNPQVNDHG